MPSTLHEDPFFGKDPEHISSTILAILEQAARTDPTLWLLLQQDAARGRLLALAVEERLCARVREEAAR